MVRWLECALVIAVIVACEPEEPVGESETIFADSSGGDSCPFVPACELCPSAAICDRPCADEPPCSDVQGAGMTCADGIWVCQGAPQRDDECSDVCTTTSECSEAGCNDGIELQLYSGASFDPGTYEVEIVRDGDASTCTFVISEGLGCELPPCVPDTTCNASFALTSSPPQITMPLPLAETLTVSVAVDGDVRVEATPPLAYELVAPNGAGCLPVCGVATVTVDVP